MEDSKEAGSQMRPAADQKFRMNIWVSQKIYAELLAIKNHEGGSITDYVRQALREFIKKYKQEHHLE